MVVAMVVTKVVVMVVIMVVVMVGINTTNSLYCFELYNSCSLIITNDSLLMIHY